MKIKNQKLLDEFRTPGPCEYCGKPCKKREPAHIISRGAGGPDFRCNLVALGSTREFACSCHSDNHAGANPNTHDLFRIASRREKTFPMAARMVVDLARRLPKDASPETIKFGISELRTESRKLATKEFKEAGLI